MVEEYPGKSTNLLALKVIATSASVACAYHTLHLFFTGRYTKKKLSGCFLRGPLSLVRSISSYLNGATSSGGITRVNKEEIECCYDVCTYVVHLLCTGVCDTHA